MKVLFTTTVPSPYRVDFFNELGKYCDLTVLFERNKFVDRDKSWENYKFDNFEGIFLSKTGKSSIFSDSCKAIRHIKLGNYNKIIVTNFSTPIGILIVNFLKKTKTPYYLESDGAFAKDCKGVKEKFKKHIISGATGYFSTGKEHDKYYCAYGAPADKLIRYHFSSISNSDMVSAPVSDAKKREFRKKLEIKEDKVVLAIGQFIHRKGFDTLIRAASNVSSNVGFYFVGGEPTEEYLFLKESYHLDNVHFVGFKNKEQLKEYYFAADIFVHPTRLDIWGLVVNEATAYGLPVITTTKCIAGLEMLSDKQMLIDPENVDALSNTINLLLSDDELRIKMSRDNLKTASEYTIEKMSADHLDLFK